MWRAPQLPNTATPSRISLERPAADAARNVILRVEAPMQYRIRQFRRPTTMLRVLVATLTSLALTTACDEQDRLPTSPPRAVPSAPQPAILGATVAGVPFTVAAINDAGQVVGTQQSGGTSRAMLRNPDGVAQDLGTLGGASSW